MSKHTPGPWSVGATRHYKCSGGAEVAIHYGPAESMGNCIAHAYGHGPSGDAEADARLIAAAPELLEALRGMMDAYADLCDDVTPSYQTYERRKARVDAARVAIAKATGEQA